MNFVGYIFARGGSKGLPGKNIKPLLGKPLIGWAIEQGLAIPELSRLIVSTDSVEIARIAEKYGAEVPFLRPSELADDSSPELLSWQHALRDYLKREGNLPEAMVSIPTTAPLRNIQDIQNCIQAYKEIRSDIVIAVTPAHRNPYFNMVKLNKQGFATILIEDSGKKIYRRQDTPEVFDITTVCYVANSKYILKASSILDGSVQTIEVPKNRAVDIDDIYDFNYAELLMKERTQW